MMIVDQEAWKDTAARLAAEDELAFDTESNSSHSYRGSICLIQIGGSGENLLVDPLAVKDLSRLGDILADPGITKVFHGADYDLRSLDRDYGFRVRGLFDTEVAAVFLGETRPNLGAVLERFLGVSIPKDPKLQRSNWALRPLTAEASEYAVNDVAYLRRLAQELRRRLVEMGRLEWVEEECRRMEAVRSSSPEPPESAFRRIKGSHRLDGRELAVLLELYVFRDEEARALDCPPFRVIRNETLLEMARSPTTPLERVPGLSPHLVRRHGALIRSALARGRDGPEFERPARTDRLYPWTPEAKRRSQALKQWRRDRGAELGLDSSLVWPTVSLERIALEPEEWHSEIANDGHGDVRCWQRQEFAGALEAFITTSILS